MRHFTVVMTHEDGGYVVTVPALPGCVTEGDGFDEALENARDVVRLYLESLEARNLPIPEETVPSQLAAVEI